MLCQQAVDQGLVADIALNEGITRVTQQCREVLQITGIGQFVEIQYRLVACTQPVENEICADKASATCHKYHVDPFLIKL